MKPFLSGIVYVLVAGAVGAATTLVLLLYILKMIK
jgi:hypothetical protein